MVTRRSLLCTSALFGAAAAIRALPSGADAGGDFPLRLSETEWRGRLAPERYAVLRRGAAEPAWSSPLLTEARHGVYGCAGCGQDLFSSAAKYDAGTGWPSFWAPFYGAVAESQDRSAFASRTAARCSRCGGHLGAVTAEAPTPTGLGYRVDGLAIAFRPAAALRRS